MTAEEQWKLECVRLAVSSGAKGPDIVDLAAQLMKFLFPAADPK